MEHNLILIVNFFHFIKHLGPSPTTCFEHFIRTHRSDFTRWYLVRPQAREQHNIIQVQNGTQVAELFTNHLKSHRNVDRFFLYYLSLNTFKVRKNARIHSSRSWGKQDTTNQGAKQMVAFAEIHSYVGWDNLSTKIECTFQFHSPYDLSFPLFNYKTNLNRKVR